MFLAATPVERLIEVLDEPTLAYLLVSFGLLGLYLELASPGITVPGVLGGASLGLGLLGLGSLPVEWTGLGLIGLAFALFLVDLFVPSLGLLTLGGLVSFVVGSRLLVEDGLPEERRVADEAIWAMTVCFAALSLVLGMLGLRGQLRRPATGAGTLLGRVGEVREALDPRGSVFLAGERWTARSAGETIVAGTAVLVMAVDGITLTVRPATDQELQQAHLAADDKVADGRYVVPPRRTAAPEGV
jgi:membrane-bound serine protease (ClpP class)